MAWRGQSPAEAGGLTPSHGMLGRSRSSRPRPPSRGASTELENSRYSQGTPEYPRRPPEYPEDLRKPRDPDIPWKSDIPWPPPIPGPGASGPPSTTLVEFQGLVRLLPICSRPFYSSRKYFRGPRGHLRRDLGRAVHLRKGRPQEGLGRTRTAPGWVVGSYRASGGRPGVPPGTPRKQHPRNPQTGKIILMFFVIVDNFQKMI